MAFRGEPVDHGVWFGHAGDDAGFLRRADE
jgi:hypothetical protein